MRNDFLIPSDTDSMELTPLETKLFFLRLIHNRMIIIAQNLPKIPETNDYDFRSVTREYAIVVIHNFIKLKRVLEKEPAFKLKPAVSSCLELYWKPIDDQAKTIEDMRNGHYAHSNDGFDMPLSELLMNKSFPSSYGDLLFLILCVCGYAEHMEANFKSELDNAIKKLNLNLDAELSHELSYDGAREKIREIEKQVIENLRNSNLVYRS